MTHLTHGWESDLDASDSLLRRYVLATADRGEAMARAIGGRARRTEVYSAADPASPVMFDNWAATLAAPDLPAVLIASDDGQSVYESMGFVRLMRLTIWHRPPAG